MVWLDWYLDNEHMSKGGNRQRGAVLLCAQGEENCVYKRSDSSDAAL